MITRRQTLQKLALGAPPLVWTAQAFAASFLSLEQAQRALLPQASEFVEQALVPDVAALKAAGLGVPAGFAPKAWLARAGEAVQGWVLLDRVVGKYELIDYAAGFNAQGQVSGVEVLVYRESHGAEIRTPAWRRQFEGRKGPAQIRFGDDIRNISGATLSCQHVTEGVQRLSALVQGLVKAREGR